MTSFPSSFLSDVFETSDVARDYFYVLSHIQLFATLWTVAHQAPLSMGILQARILEWIVISFSRGSSQSRDQVFCIAGRFFTVWATREAQWVGSERIQEKHLVTRVRPYRVPFSFFQEMFHFVAASAVWILKWRCKSWAPNQLAVDM